MSRLVQKAILMPIGLMACLASAAGLAGEGRLEINQTCAVNGGCFAGDNPGFPVEIQNKGSYVLTSDLDVTVADDPPNTIAISISAEHVSVDLGGFVIQGPAICSGTPVTSCSNTTTEGFGAGTGIEGSFWTTIRNGTITGMGADGLRASDGSRVLNVTFHSNGINGLFGSEGIVVDGVVADRNGRAGIRLNSDSVVRNARASDNAQDGITADTGSVVSNVTASGNGRNGIFVADGANVQGVTARDNVAAGLLLRDGMVVESTFFGNGGFGIECDSSIAAVAGNTLANNSGTSQVDSTCTLVADNLCGGGAC